MTRLVLCGTLVSEVICFGVNTVKVIDTTTGEKVISFDPNEVLESSTVREAYIRMGCSKKEAKENTSNIYEALETLLVDRACKPPIRDKRRTRTKEERQADFAYKMALIRIKRI
jgi:hypothetical protein